MIKGILCSDVMSSNSLEKQILFEERQGIRLWSKIGRSLNIDKHQAIKLIMRKNDFLQFLEERFKDERPKAAKRSREKTR